MPTLQVRELPEDIYARLQARAAAEHRSIAQETIVLLRSALSVPESRKAERKMILDRIRARKIPDAAKLPSSGDIIRHDRER